jgi:hypothetical protein
LISDADHRGRSCGGLLRKTLIVMGLSTRKEFVTARTRLWGGVVPRLCVFIPDPARPGDPPGRLHLKFLQKLVLLKLVPARPPAFSGLHTPFQLA